MTGTDHEDQCAAVVAAIAEGTSAEQFLSDPLIVGPGFAHAMAGGQTRFPFGKAMVLFGVYGGRQMFFLGHAVQGDKQASMLASSAFRDFLRGFKDQEARPATREEREVYYSLIAWEIEGQSVTVIRDGQRRLLLQSFEEGKLFWIDMIDQYPVPSVAQDFEEVAKLVSAINDGA